MAEDGHTRGRPGAWVAVIIILGGFVLGGIALIISQWWLFWVSVAIVVIGGIVGLVVDIFSNVELDPIVPGEEVHVSPIKGEVTASAPGGATATDASASQASGADRAEGTADA